MLNCAKTQLETISKPTRQPLPIRVFIAEKFFGDA